MRGIKNLHSKVYLFGAAHALVTSANLTDKALSRNHEFGVVSEDQEFIRTCQIYFDRLWRIGKIDLTAAQIENWDESVTKYRAKGAGPNPPAGLGDFGADAGIVNSPTLHLPTAIADASRAFVKFLGEGHRRSPLSRETLEEVDRAGCRWAVAYPASKRPRRVKDGDIIYIGRLIENPNDIRVFGRAIGMRHVPGRDDATPKDIARRDWKEDWPRYVRVHHAEFVAGKMANGVSLNELMNVLGKTRMPTARNAALGAGNIDPRKAYRQQAAVQLTADGKSWLDDRLQDAFQTYGTIPQDALDKLDWPVVPS